MFENIGIGGVLQFESKGAVTNMGMAERAFGSLGRAATGARAGVSKIGEGMAAFQLMGGLGVAGMVYGFKQLVHEGMAWNEYVQTAQISIGTILAAVTKTPLAENIQYADKVLQHLNIVATQTHVETSEVVDTFSRLVGPLMGAGASLNQIYEYTKGTTILASALHQPVNRASHAISMLAGGTLIAREQTIQLLHSMNLLHESSAEWAALLPEQRLKRIKEIMSTFEASGEYLQKTWVAQASSAKSFAKIMAGAFTKGMFDQGTGALERFNNAFIANQDAWLERIGKFGHAFAGVITWLSTEVMQFYGNIRKVTNFIQDKLDYFDDDRLPGIAKGTAHVLVQFMLFATALSPVISIIGFIGSKVMALVTIAEGLIAVISAIAVPLLIIGGIAVGVFLLIRRQGESVGDTFIRIWDAIKEIGSRLWAPIADSIGVVMSAVDELRASAGKLWDGIQPGMENFKAVLMGVIDLVVSLWQGIAPIIAKIFAGAVRIFEAIRPGIEAVFNGVMKVANVVMQGINYIVPKLMPIISAIVDVVMAVGEKIGMVLSKLFGILTPLFDAMAYIFKEILFPILGWMIDVFGPIFIGVWKALGWVLGKILDGVGWLLDAIKWLIEKVGGALKWAFEGVRDILKWMVDKIMWVVEKIEWLGRKIADIASSIGDAAGSAWDWAKNAANPMYGVAQQFEAVNAAAMEGNKAALSFTDMLKQQMWLARMHALGTEGVIKLIASELTDVYDKYVKPALDPLISIVNAISGTADIKAKHPDVNVNVDVKANATMCVNGRNLAVAQGQYETEVAERSGFNKTPWQTQRVQISGVKQ